MSIAASAAVLDGEALAQLRGEFRGQILEPEEAGYDDSRHVFNGMFADRRPRVVLRPAGAADVIRAIGFATMSGLPFAIRGGGHSVAGFSTCDGGIVLDMSSMKGIRVDPERRTVRAQPGLTWGELDRETQAFGRARHQHRDRRLHARHRQRLARAQARLRLRQPRPGRRRDRRR